MVNLMFGCTFFRCYRIFCSTYKLIYYIISIGFKMCIKFVLPLFYATKLQKCHPHTSNSGLPFFTLHERHLFKGLCIQTGYY